MNPGEDTKVNLIKEEEKQPSEDLFELELGEYFLHFYIMETSGLEFEDEIDVLIKLTAFGQVKFTRIIKNQGSGSQTFWGEHIFFEKKFEVRQDMENDNFRIEILNHNSIFKNDLIGETTGSTLQIYSEPKHTIFNKWDILSNPRKNFKKPMGFIKYSVSFSKATDARTNLELQNSKNEESQLVIPSNIQLAQKQIIVKVFKADKIIPMDGNGKADPYLKLFLGGLEIKSKVLKETLAPTFNEVLKIPTIYPTITQNIKLSFLDEDGLLNKDDFIGSKYFKLTDISKGVYRFPTWNYFYGSPKVTVDKETEKKMNEFPEIASTFKGALLMSISMEDSEQPSFVREDFLKGDEAEGNNLKKIEFTARFDVEFIQNLNSKAQPHKICMNWGGITVLSKDVKYNRGVLIVFERLEITQLLEVSVKGENEKNYYNQLPDVIISVLIENKHISFYRFKSSEFQLTRNSASSALVISLKTDKSVSDLRQDMAGLMRLRCAVSEKNDFLALTASVWPAINIKPTFEPIRIICYIFQAKDLPPSDSNGSSDPIIQIYHFGSFVKSSFFPKTLNPTWNERVVLESYLVDGTLPPIVANFWDRDVSFMGDVDHEFMGSTIIKLDPTFFVSDKNQVLDIKAPKWYEIAFDGTDKSGKTLLSFSVVRQNMFEAVDKANIMQKISYIPIEREKHHIKINILGLRNLESTGILPVKRVKIQINTSSLKEISKMREGAAFTELVAVAKNGGKNPTIGSILSLSVDLPSNISNMPSLSCQVIDEGLRLFNSQQIIGSFQINLGAYSFLSKYTLLEKLRVLLDREEKSLIKKPDVQKYADNLMILKPLIFKLDQEVGINNSSIQNDFKDLWNGSKKNDIHLDENEEDEETKQSSNVMDLGITTVVRPESTGVEIEEEEYKESKMTLKTDLIEYKEESIIGNKVGGILITKNKTLDPEEEIKKVLLKKKGKEFFTQAENKSLFEKFQSAVDKNIPIILMPKYKEKKTTAKDTIAETEIPDSTIYYSLGYKSNKKNTKHYRLYLDRNLEESHYMGEDAFTTIDMFRGKRYDNDKKNFLERLFTPKTELHHKTGTFRGNIEIIEDSILTELTKLQIREKDRQILELPSSLESWKYSKTDSEMLKTVDVVIRVYIIDAQFYESLDYNSENDSYLILELGNKKIVDSRRIENENNPQIFKKFEFEHSFPGPSDLKIKLMDEDPFKADELIGETSIDVERRFFDKTWRSFKDKPIEQRKLYLPTLARATGTLRCWVDIVNKEEANNVAKYDIEPRPLTNLEVRVVVWEVHDVPNMDFEEVSDLYVNVNMTNFNLSHKTDTHFRSQNGFGSFNWRTLFKLKIDEYTKPEMFRLDFKIYDKDLTPDDFICNTTLDISELVQDVLMNEKRMSYFGKGIDGSAESREFCLDTRLAKSPGPNQEFKTPRIMLSIDVLTEEEAKVNPAGFGRSDPNQDPYLPEPIGRFKFSLNPFTMLNQLVGPGFRLKMYLCVGLTLFCFIIILFLPTLLSSVVANLIS